MGIFKSRNPTFLQRLFNWQSSRPVEKNRLEMITSYEEYFYNWNGKLYDSDIIRACIRPKVKAIGKLVGKHIRDDPKTGLKVNPEPYIRFLLEEPNQYMTGQMLQEKMSTQLSLNNNAFALIVRDEEGYAEKVFPIPAITAEALYDNNGNLFLKFTFKNGKTQIWSYENIIHLRDDFGENDIFGSSPAPALSQLMECVGTIDQGIVKAVRNSGIIRWLLKFNQAMRPEDIKLRTQEFVNNYLSYESDTFGAAGVDSKVDAKQIEPKDYVPNSSVTDKITERIYSFFNTNKDIVMSKFDEDTWNAYYENCIEPVAIQISGQFTNKLFSRRERAWGNKIVFEAYNLQYASLKTKLEFQAMVDRGAMLPNEWRATLSLAPIEGGDKPIRRLDTAVVDMIEEILGKMDQTNYPVMADLIGKILNARGGEEDAKRICQRSDHTDQS